MVVTIWCAIGTERGAISAGKMAMARTLVIMVFPAKKVFPGRCVRLEKFQDQI